MLCAAGLAGPRPATHKLCEETARIVCGDRGALHCRRHSEAEHLALCRRASVCGAVREGEARPLAGGRDSDGAVVAATGGGGGGVDICEASVGGAGCRGAIGEGPESEDVNERERAITERRGEGERER